MDNTERNRKWREELKKDPEKYEAYLKKRRQYYRGVMSDPERRARRKLKSKEWRERNREHIARVDYSNNIRKKFSLSPEETEDLVVRSEGVCEVCGSKCSTNSRLSVDHCHETGSIRGLLCNSCNTGLGKFRDDPALLEKAAAYLRK